MDMPLATSWRINEESKSYRHTCINKPTSHRLWQDDGNELDQYTDYAHNDQWFVVINGEQWIIAWYALIDVDHIEIADRFPR